MEDWKVFRDAVITFFQLASTFLRAKSEDAGKSAGAIAAYMLGYIAETFPILTFFSGMGIWGIAVGIVKAPALISERYGRWIDQMERVSGNYALDPLWPFAWAFGMFRTSFNVITDQLTYQALPFQRWYKKEYREDRLSASDYTQLYNRNLVDTRDIKNEMQELGLRDEDIDRLLAAATTLPGVQFVLEAYLRGEYSPLEASTQLRSHGISDKYHDLILRLQRPLMTIDQLLQAETKGWLADGEYQSFGQKLGYSADQLQIMKNASGEPLSVGQMLDLQNRAEGVALADARGIPVTASEAEWRNPNIQQDVVQAILEGPLNNRWIPYIQKLRYSLLGISDYIRFAVKEAYGPKENDGSQIANEYPAELAYKARMLGYSPEDAFAAWAAHYELPSPTQVYTMLHRRLITPAQVQDYLAKADYLPEWRELLEKISYNPLTRTDAKRAFKIGAIDDNELRMAYLDEGYNDANAEILVNFAKADILGEKRSEQELLYGPIKSSLLTMYKSRRIERDLLEKQLLAMKFTQEQIEMFIDQAEFTRQVDHAEDVAAALKSAYIKAKRSRADTKQLMMNAGYSDAMAEQVLEPWDLLRQVTEMTDEQVKQRDLSKAEVITAYTDGLLDTPQATKMLKDMGYDDDETSLLIHTADYRKASEQQKIEIEYIHQKYLSNLISLDQASIELDGTSASSGQKKIALMKWSRENINKTATFSLSQIKEFYKVSAITQADFFTYMRALGYNQQQMDTFLLSWNREFNYPPDGKWEAATKLTRKDAEAAFFRDKAGEKIAQQILTDAKYRAQDITYLLGVWGASKAELEKLLK